MALCTDNIVKFNVLHDSREVSFNLQECDSVWDLKIEIFDKLKILPSKQVIDCWYKSPEADDDILGICCHPSANHLVVYDMDYLKEKEKMAENVKELEICAALEFIEYFSNNFDDRGLVFHMCRLEDALSEACFTSLGNKKILLLYFHNKNDKFAKNFAENLIRPEVKELVNDKFFFLGWNLENERYHPALIEALSSRAELSALENFIETKVCAALLIVPVKNSFTLFSCIKGKVSKKDFLETLKKAGEFLVTENESERCLEDEEQSENDIGSSNYQQIMLDLLGDRDYDSFDHFEFDKLKDKIGYALYGPPQQETGYDDKQKKKMEFLFEVIVKQSNIFTKWKDRIVISFIYNCTEPLPSEKQKRSKKYKDYNPKTDLTPIPIFVLRKCKNSPNPCRIFIDDTGRVYKTWQAYLTRNKLPECEMILPLNGRYQADENGNVILERHLSPSCGIGSKILQVTDVSTTTAGLVSGGIFIAAAIPTITVAPVALVVAGATGLGVGLYSLGRSAYTLYDRNKHKETLSFVNSEARGAYLSIVAGSLGFVGAGANVAVSQLAAKGFNIGQGATTVVNVINVANVGASGVNVANSSYDIWDQWFRENQAPSLLTIVQLSSSILFFGHAVYNFKSAGVIVEEAQAKTLSDYYDSLRSNKHRKTFNKMMKETVRQNNGDAVKGRAEVIKTITSIENKDDVFATLTRLNKQMNKNDVKFSADNGVIKLNGESVDMNILRTMDNNEVVTFLGTLPSTPEPTPNQVGAMSTQLKSSFTWATTQEVGILAFNLVKIFSNTEDGIKDKIINAFSAVVNTVRSIYPGCFKELGVIFSGWDKYVRLVQMVNGYFQSLVSAIEEQYQKWLNTKDPQYEQPYFPKLALEVAKRATQIFDFVTRTYFMGTTLTEAGLKELLNYFFAWFAKQAVDYGKRMQRKQMRAIHSGTPSGKTRCPDCGGVYYH